MTHHGWDSCKKEQPCYGGRSKFGNYQTLSKPILAYYIYIYIYIYIYTIGNILSGKCAGKSASKDCCGAHYRCGDGEGDCDDDLDCLPGFKCDADHNPLSYDYCVPSKRLTT